MLVLVAQLCLTVCDPHELQPTRLLCPWDFSGKHTGVGCHFLLQTSTVAHPQNPLKWQGWRKGKFALLGMLATNWGMQTDSCPKANSSRTPPNWQSVGKSFYIWKERANAETARSALTVILKMVSRGLISIILIVLSTINLQLQGWVFPIFLGPELRTAAPISWLQSGYQVVNLFHPAGISGSIRQLTGYGPEYNL